MLKTLGTQLPDGRWLSPSVERNKAPILAELQRVLPSEGLVLEIASGTGQHVAYFARALPALTWQPSDADAAFRDSIRTWIELERLSNIRGPVELDVREPWPVPHADAVTCINMIHVAPWAATQALLEGAKAVLPRGGTLFLCGPYRRFGRHTAASNEAFDAQLRASNPEWGLRDLEAVLELAGDVGFSSANIVDMPANNFSVVLRSA